MTKTKQASPYVRLSLWIFIGLLAYMPLHIFLSTWIGSLSGYLELTRVAKEVVLILGFILITLASVRRPWFMGFLKQPLVMLIIAYASLTLLLAIIQPTDTDAELLGLIYNTRFLVFFLYGWLLTKYFDTEIIQRLAIKTVLFVGLIVSFVGVLQYLVLPNDVMQYFGYSRENGALSAFYIDNKPDLERVMSTIRDPNSLGSYLIIIISFCTAMLCGKSKHQSRKFLITLLILSGLCLVFTFSRSAWLGLILSAGVLALFGLGITRQKIYRYKKPILLGVVAMIIAVASILVSAKDSYFVQNVIFHADASTMLEDPNELRIRFVQESVQDIAANPFGSGPGTAGLASIRNDLQGVKLNENYYLQIATEVGLLGLGLFMAILYFIGRKLIALRQDMLALGLLAALAGLLFTNLLVHIWANEAVAYTWWGLCGLVIATYKTTTRNSTTIRRQS